MLTYLLLIVFSVLAPQGMNAVHPGTPDRFEAVFIHPSGEDHAFFQPAAHDHSQFPDSPAEVEEELREYKGSHVQHTVVLRVCLSFLSGFLAPSPCLASPPRVLRKARFEPAATTPLTILHRSLLI